MKTSRKKSISLVVLQFVLLFAIISASSFAFLWPRNQKKADDEKGTLQLKIWYPWTDKYELYERAFLQSVEEYNQKHSEINIQPQGIEMEFYREKLPTTIASNDAPDIYFCFADAYLENIVKSGKILKMNSYLEDNLEDKIRIETLENMTFDGGIYALSFAETIGVFLVNNEMFQRYGCEIPETWEQLVEVCETFLKYGITPLACSKDEDIGFRMYLEAICMNEAGGENCERIVTGKSFVDEAFSCGVQNFEKLAAMGAFGKIPVQKNTIEMEELFYLSRIPMYYTKSSFIGNIIQKNNPLYTKISIHPFPGKRREEFLGGVSECFVVNADTKYPEEAVNALQEILKDFSGHLYESGAGIPTWNVNEKEMSDQLLYQEMLEMLGSAEYYMQFWEFTMNGKQRKEYMEVSREYFEANREY